MLISMTPNEEVKTIHASLNDGSLRKWEFEPYTEQGKIELTDQDYATIQKIKGNTVKFNQLVKNGNFADTSGWLPTNGITIVSASNNKLTFNSNNYNGVIYKESNLTIPKNHKFYLKLKISSAPRVQITFYSSSWQTLALNVELTKNGEWQTGYFNALNEIASIMYIRPMVSDSINYTLENVQIFDLTAIFGSGNEPSTVSDFETWLSNNIGLLPYYDYTLGSLISFNGTGLKTVGFNQWDEEWELGTFDFNGAEVSVNDRIRSKNYIPCIAGKTYYYKSPVYGYFFFYDSEKNSVSTQTTKAPDSTITVPSGAFYMRFRLDPLYGTTYNNDICINISDTSRNGTYESYTESTLSLPISTYFPTGMKDSSVTYEVVDELTNSEATTKVGMVDLGTLNYEKQATAGGFRFLTDLNGVVGSGSGGIKPNILCNKYATITPDATWTNNRGVSVNNIDLKVMVCDDYYNDFTVEQFKNAMSGVMLYYELATPTSQDISLDLTYPVWNNGTEQILPVNSSTPTTSPMVATIEYPDRTEDVDFLYKQTTFESAIPQFSLVCKNQELPMTLEDGKLICECDSSITNESGFFDCKVKMQDLDSVAYSQKIQLHVERGIND